MKEKELILIAGLIIAITTLWGLSIYQYQSTPCDEHKIVECELGGRIIIESDVKCYENECAFRGNPIFVMAQLMTLVFIFVTFVVWRKTK